MAYDGVGSEPLRPAGHDPARAALRAADQHGSGGRGDEGGRPEDEDEVDGEAGYFN